MSFEYFLAGVFFSLALGLDGLMAGLSGLGAILWERYRGRFRYECSVWLILFAVAAWSGLPVLSAASAGPVSICILRLFTSRVSLFGRSIPAIKKTGGKRCIILVSVGWLLIGLCARLDPIVVLFSQHVFMVDMAHLAPLLIPLPVMAVLFFLPDSSSRKAMENSTPKEVDFRELSQNWLSPDRDEPSKKDPVDTEIRFTASGPQSAQIQSFWRRIQSYREILEEFDLLIAVKKLLEILDAQGNVPSVRRKDKKDSLREPDQYEALSRIPLALHSLNVARNVIGAIEERFPENVSQHLPGLLVAALAHDIGKLDMVSGKSYVTGQHPVDGANYLSEELLAGHPWAEKIADFVRRHHEAIVDRTPVDLAILIRADKKARAKEEESLSQKAQERTPAPPSKNYPPKVEELPPSFPLERIFERLNDVVNVLLPNKSWVAFSQPDGIVYLQAEVLHETISRIAQEEGYADELYHSTKPEIKKSCLQTFYDAFRRQGWVPDGLVGSRFYGNFFWVWNPVNRKKIRTFYVPIKAEAFRREPADLEAQRKSHAILSAVKVLGVAQNSN